MDITIVIPVYNNQKTIKPLFIKVSNVLSELNKKWEIIFVNDASKDDSGSVMNDLAASFQNVKCIHLSKNVGQNMALFNGFKLAKGNEVLSMDADLQDNPDMINSLITALNNEAEVVFIKRVGKYQSSLRMLTSILFKSFLQLLTGLHRKAGSYYIMNRSIASKVINMNCRFPIMTIMVYCLADKVKYIEAQRQNNEGQSSYTFRRRCHYALRALHCAIQCKIAKLKS